MGIRRELGRVFVLAGAMVLALVSPVLLDAGQAGAVFPGENGKIVYQRGSGLWVMGPDGRDKRRLTHQAGAADGPAAWAPGGRWLAFARTFPRPQAQIDSYLMVIKANGTHPRRLLPAAKVLTSLSWSPGGERIAYGDATDYRIRIVDRHGHQLRRLRGFGDSPDFSPNGRWISYEGPSGIFVSRANGKDRRRVTANRFADGLDTAPDWSPDGKRIVFESWHPDSSGQTSASDIFVVNADGSNLEQLTFDGSSRDPTFSPDGQEIAFSSESNNNEDAYVLNLETSELDRLTTTPGADGVLDWARRSN